MVSSPQHKLAQSPNLQPQHTSPAADAESAAESIDQERYAAMFKQLDAEALYTLLAAVLITLLFWLAIYLTHESSVSFWHMPLWFVLSCLGGYVLSVVVVVILVKCFLKDMPLHLPRCATEDDPDTSMQNAPAPEPAPAVTAASASHSKES